MNYNKVVGSDARLEQAVSRLNEVRYEIAKIIVGQQDVVEGVLICLIAAGHVLLEGVPGLGKTTLLRTMARALQLKYSRIQFTPDLMPADIVGSMIIETSDRGSKSLRFQPGPIFAHLVLADEINRATPKTQSALLEAMQERTVTSGTSTHELAKKYVRYGSSPRGAQALVECGRVRALMRGRYHLSTEDIEAVALSVLRHRIILNFDGHAEGQTPDSILSAIVREATALASTA